MSTRTKPEKARNDLTGQRVGGSYKITRQLGAGGMGEVWLAHASGLDDKEAAVKVLNREALEKPEYLMRFMAEVRVVGGLRSNDVVEVWDAGELLDGRHYMIMEFCDGGSLAALLDKKGPLGVEETFIYASGVAQALVLAHAKGITHRDVKPDNILLVREDDRLRAKLSDFGIAKLNIDKLDGRPMTGTGRAMGTPGYMAPEQINPRNATSVDPRADIFSFGCVLYQCLTGRLPFPNGTFYQYVEAVLAKPVRPANPRKIRPEIPLELDGLIMECMAFDRGKRPRSIDEVMRRFARAIASGQALLQFFAPRLVDREIAPTARTIPDSTGVAATEFVADLSRALDQQRRAAIRKIFGALVVGAMLGGIAGGLASRPRARANTESAELASAATTRSVVPPAPAPSRKVIPAAAPPTSDPAALPPAPPVVATPAPAPAPAAAPPASRPGPSKPAAPAKPASVQPPKLSAPASDAARKPSVIETGELIVSVDPYAVVWLDNKKIGETPLSTQAPVGHHRLRLVNNDLGVEKVVDVTITADKPARVEESW